jgi:uncharacterized membrane protein (DUF485 family)
MVNIEKYTNKPVNLKDVGDFNNILSDRADYMIEYLEKEDVFNINNKDAFTVGINGQWGAGKTSYINILLYKLMCKGFIKTNSNSKKLDIEEEIRGNENIIFLEPWHFNDEKILTNYFLETLESKFIKSGLLKSDKSKVDFEKYINLLSPNSFIKSFFHLLNLLKSDDFLLISSICVSILYIAYIMPVLFFKSFVNNLLLTNDISVFNFSILFITLFIYRVYKILSNDSTLGDLKNKISDTLQNSQSKYFVIIDDIDRLSKKEVQEVFKYVKQVLDFPNIIFILSFDKKHVSHQIKEEFAYKDETSAYLYLNKIVDIYENLEINSIDNLQYLNMLIKKYRKTNQSYKLLTFEKPYEIYNNKFKELYNILDLGLYGNIESSNKKDYSSWRFAFEDLAQDLTFRDINQITLKFLHSIDKNNWIIYDFKYLLLISILEYKYPEAYSLLKPLYPYNQTGFKYLILDNGTNANSNETLLLKSIKSKHQKLLKEFPHLNMVFELIINEKFFKNQDSNGNNRPFTLSGYEDEFYNCNKYHFDSNITKFKRYLDNFSDNYEVVYEKFNVKANLTHQDIEMLLYIDGNTQLTNYTKEDIVSVVFNDIYSDEEKQYILYNIIMNYNDICNNFLWVLNEETINKVILNKNYGNNIYQLINLTKLFSESSRNDIESKRLYNKIKIKNGKEILKLVDAGVLIDSESLALALLKLIYFRFNSGEGRRGGYILAQEKVKNVKILLKESNPSISDNFELFKEVIFKRNKIDSRDLTWDELEPLVNSMKIGDNQFFKDLANDIELNRDKYIGR